MCSPGDLGFGSISVARFLQAALESDLRDHFPIASLTAFFPSPKLRILALFWGYREKAAVKKLSKASKR